MSLIALAELLDRLQADASGRISETEGAVTVSNLQLPHARAVVAAVDALGWQMTIVDSAETEWQPNDLQDLAEGFAPIRVIATKPPPPAGVLQIVTNTGFGSFLQTGHPSAIWSVARLQESILTQGRMYAAWAAAPTFQPHPTTKSPRLLVREFENTRKVPDDVRPWLLIGKNPQRTNDPTFQVWANASIRALVQTLPNEIEPETGNLKFKGPPRLTMSPVSVADNSVDAIGAEAFFELQKAVAWVFEDEREAEMRHIFLSTEIAQSGGQSAHALACLKEYVGAALDGAKIAYQMSRSELSRDTLKSLGDLRKSVTEEIAKVNDTTRQLATAVAGAIGIGIGLIAARISTTIDPMVLRGVMIVVLAYILVVCLAGYQFIRLQQDLRKDWQTRLYRFLPKDDFKKMVTSPTERAELTFKISAGVAFLAILLLTVLIFSVSAQKLHIAPVQSPTGAVDSTTGASQPPPNPAIPRQDSRN